jgi:hypothetical protein
MREIGAKEGLPPLPKVDLLLYKSATATSKAASALHDYLAHYLNLDDELLLGTELPLTVGHHPGSAGPSEQPALKASSSACTFIRAADAQDGAAAEIPGTRRIRPPDQVYRPRARRPV